MGEAELEVRMKRMLAKRNFLAPDGETTLFGMPAVRRVPERCGPEALADAQPWQRRLVELAYATPWPGPNSCALWVEHAFVRLGYGALPGDAHELCRAWCGLDDLSLLKVGMGVGVERHPFDAYGLAYGHIGLYIGDGQVRDACGTCVRTVPLDAWLSVYGAMEDPRWGWLGGLALDRMQPALQA